MQKIPIGLAQDGMVLEKPVMRENGMVLVGEGTGLTSALIGRLENMGISKIVVKGEPLDLDEAGGGNTSFTKRIERLDHLFRHYTDDEWMLKVKEFVRAYYLEKAAVESASAKEIGEEQKGE